MSLWGKSDSVALTGTGSITTGTNAVVGVGTLFTTELAVENVISISTSLFRVTAITDDLNMTVEPVAAGTLTTQALVLVLMPTFVGTEDLDEVALVTTAEAQTEISRDLGIKTPGWNKVNSYTDAQGATRSKVENLVVFKS